MVRRGYDFIPIFSVDEHQEEDDCFAYWCMSHKELVVNLKVFNWEYKNKPYQLYKKIINTISHEVIHGVIQKILEKDRFSGQLDTEFPMMNGMDPTMRKRLK